MAGDYVDVQTRYGRVRGEAAAAGVVAFRGIPYAAAPIGDLRFRAPRAHAGWDGVRDATREGPSAPQLPMPLPGVEELEWWIRGDEYLNLNVWTPDPGA